VGILAGEKVTLEEEDTVELLTVFGWLKEVPMSTKAEVLACHSHHPTVGMYLERCIAQQLGLLAELLLLASQSPTE
jgi:hypothetical protein